MYELCDSLLEIVDIDKQPHRKEKICELLMKNGWMRASTIKTMDIFKGSLIATLREGVNVAYVIASKWEDHIHINYLVSSGGGIGTKLMFSFIDEMEMDIELTIRKDNREFLTEYYGNLGFVPTNGLTMLLEY